MAKVAKSYVIPGRVGQTFELGAAPGGWSTLNSTTQGALPFRFCFLKGWAILLFALS